MASESRWLTAPQWRCPTAPGWRCSMDLRWRCSTELRWRCSTELRWRCSTTTGPRSALSCECRRAGARKRPGCSCRGRWRPKRKWRKPTCECWNSSLLSFLRLAKMRRKTRRVQQTYPTNGFFGSATNFLPGIVTFRRDRTFLALVSLTAASRRLRRCSCDQISHLPNC